MTEVNCSSALAIFLIVGIFALVKINQILKDLKSISEKAEKLADQAESVGEFFSKAAKPAAIGRLLVNLAESVRQRKHSKRSNADYE